MLNIHVSTVADGSMKWTDDNWQSVLPARQGFLEKQAISPHGTTLVQLVYEGNDYCRYRTLDAADKGDGITRTASIISDGLVVTSPGHALLLPLADCIGAVIHDPTLNILMLSHLGRHNLEQLGGTKSIEYLVDHHGIDPGNATVWLSPAAGAASYPLYAFDNRGMQDVATEQLTNAGVLPANITVSSTDTTKDKNYYSHSQFLQGNRPDNGRFAVVATMD